MITISDARPGSPVEDGWGSGHGISAISREGAAGVQVGDNGLLD